MFPETDSPFRETANIKDGSNITADMAVQISPERSAGHDHVRPFQRRRCGIGKAFNGGFGLVLDGSGADRPHYPFGHGVGCDERIARRSWAVIPTPWKCTAEWNGKHAARGRITRPALAADELIARLVAE
jgi:urocanate hydratase